MCRIVDLNGYAEIGFRGVLSVLVAVAYGYLIGHVIPAQRRK